ncbi:hypothetical protein EYC84_004362 [Monilinia fructicola]|uniref:Uncharacterized protein n=1 Tax=Monilinia fructicola TaxID=38448 RepID=A0A5M9K0V6_MONFR|nr:hypothetical protein EYC84_004362 [Monilinia fructicola]
MHACMHLWRVSMSMSACQHDDVDVHFHIPPSSHPSIHSYHSNTPNTGFILVYPRTICMHGMNILIPIPPLSLHRLPFYHLCTAREIKNRAEFFITPAPSLKPRNDRRLET